MDIIYRIDGSDMTRDKDVAYIPQEGWRLLINGNKYVMQAPTLDFDAFEPVIYIELVRAVEVSLTSIPSNGVAKCTNVFAQGKSLTVGKHYPIIKIEDRCFTIINDEGIRKKYKHGNSQFVILKQ